MAIYKLIFLFDSLLCPLRCESVVVLLVSIFCICDCMTDAVFLQFLFVAIATLPLNYCRMIEKYMALFKFVCGLHQFDNMYNISYYSVFTTESKIKAKIPVLFLTRHTRSDRFRYGSVRFYSIWFHCMRAYVRGWFVGCLRLIFYSKFVSILFWFLILHRENNAI